MEKPYKHEQKLCPRCGSNFECKVGDIANCQCNDICFTNTAMEFISKNYDDCLCRKCLTALNNEPALLKVHPIIMNNKQVSVTTPNEN